MAIFAFSILVGPPAEATTGWLRARPSTSSVSSMVPPTFFTILMSRKSTFEDVEETSLVTAETAIGARTEEYWETICKSVSDDHKRRTLEFKDVLAARSKLSRSFKSTGVEMSSRNSTAFAAAFWKL